MNPKVISQDDLYTIIQKQVEEAGSQKAFAEKIGISQAYLSDILAGTEISDAVAQKLGYTLVKMYVEKQP